MKKALIIVASILALASVYLLGFINGGNYRELVLISQIMGIQQSGKDAYDKHNTKTNELHMVSSPSWTIGRKNEYRLSVMHDENGKFVSIVLDNN